MSAIGIELTPEVVRAVVTGGWRRAPRRTLELRWDPTRPEDVVRLLRDQLGPATRIGVSVGLGFLHVKPVSLPPVPHEAKRQMVALEPDRFFPVQDEAVHVSVAAGDGTTGDVAFAVPAALLDRWLAALAAWGAIDRVEPAPVSVARLARAARLRDGAYAVDAAPDETGIVELRGGAIVRVRRAPASEASVPKLAVPGVDTAFLAAWGAARGIDGNDAGSIAPPLVERAAAGRRARGLVVAAAACVAAVIFALWAFDRSRARLLQRIDSAVAAAVPRAEPALALQTRLAALEREAATLSARPSVGSRDPLRVLAALTERLPRDATVLTLRATGDDWTVDGTAADAAAILPLLDRDERFENVRFLSATSRFREGSRTYETFSIGFHVRPGA
jgi:type IV pilus assembly PilN-like protein